MNATVKKKFVRISQRIFATQIMVIIASQNLIRKWIHLLFDYEWFYHTNMIHK